MSSSKFDGFFFCRYNVKFSAGVAQLVERNLAKVEVASSRLVSRSIENLSPGGVAEWSCSGLQSRLRRFDSDPRLHQSIAFLAFGELSYQLWF